MQRDWIGFNRSLIFLVGAMLSPQLWAADFAATTEWHRLLELSPVRTGIVEKVPVDVGALLNKGDLLLQLQHKVESTQLLFAQENLRQSELLHKEAQREYERSEDLYDRTLLSDHDRALGEAAWVGASAALQLAKSELAKAEREVQLTQLKTPYDAIVVARDVEVGATFNHQLPHSALMMIASRASMAVDGYLDSSQLGNIKKGQPAQVKFAGKVHKGRVESVAMVSSPHKAGKYRLRILVPYQKGLRAGMKAVISFD
ncbi:MAG: efflux RND transporter periplasmic adaptor subunit [Gammaproteobacteria bacterium]|nr:efflux RND transporter periplasmic adaptor subunit [Gammaproteobacteria bacterium]